MGINDKKYLDTQLEYGNIALYQRHGRKWEAVSTSGYDCPLSKKFDEDAVEKARAEKEAKLDEISVKEAALDIEKNHLETERATLVAEEESLKNLIKKNIENFKLFKYLA